MLGRGRVATAMACSGESVTTTMPLEPRVDSISARRRASATNRSIDAVTSSANASFQVTNQAGRRDRARPANHIDGGEIGWIGAVGDHPPRMARQRTTGRRPCRRPPAWQRDIDVARTDDDIDGPNRLGAMRDADRLRPADRHDLVGACDLRRRERVGDLAIRAGRTHTTICSTPPPPERRHEHGRG